MQKADLTGSGSTTTQMAHSGGESTTTTASGTESSRTTAPMAHYGGESTGTMVRKEELKSGGINKV